MFRALIACALVLMLLGCGVDRGQADLCAQIIVAVNEPGTRFEVTGSESAGEAGVVVHYRTEPAGEHWVSCRFAGRGLDVERLEITAVETDTDGQLSGVRLHMIKRYWLQDFDARARRHPGPEGSGWTWRLHGLFLTQQMINAIVVCCVYALLAVGYALAYGIAQRINLAFGDLAMTGAVSAVLFAVVAASTGAVGLAAAVALVLAATVVLGSLQGLGVARAVFLPLARHPGQAALISTLGLAIALQEYVRLVQGARERWLQPVFATPRRLAGDEAFSVSVSDGQLLIAGLTFGLVLFLWWLFAGTAFGRAYRAAADDPGMAALTGVAVGRVTALSFALGAGFAAAAGCIIALHYGGVSFYMGTVLGFKALTAAVVGGLGSPAGAVLGGALIGLLETFWSAYLPAAHRDIVVFAVLALVLIFRPQGLLGRPTGRGDAY
jgi:branched-chain amino acid transport system permease protein